MEQYSRRSGNGFTPGWIGRLVRGAAGLVPGGQGDDRAGDPLDELALLVRRSHGSAEARAAVVFLAQRLSGAERVELWLPEEPGRASRRVAWWPSCEGVASGVEAPAPLVLPLLSGGQTRGTLRFFPNHCGRAWPARLIRRLTTFGTLAAATGLWAAPVAGSDSIRDPLTGAHNGAFLAAYMTQAVAQARRTGDPLALLCVGLDSAARHDPAEAASMMSRVVRTMLGALRSSDVVARLDDDRLAVALPGAGLAAAQKLAVSLQRAIAEAEPAPMAAHPVTVSLGVAGLPEHAREPGPLLAAAREALARAQSDGTGRIVVAPPLGGTGLSTLLHRVG
jgi:diguanylate cyclase (GGDEF)-like protein